MSLSTLLDPNQIVKRTYDEATSSVSVVPTYVDTVILVNSVSAASNFSSSAVNVLAYKVTGMMINWFGLDHTDGSIQFQGSIDGTIYENIGSSVALNSALSQKGVSFIDEPYKYIKAVYSHGSNSTGSITIKYIQRA